jgi:predicted pyridoxine 5'-phosphate oxidase superfamily flavin-nucleotide-binding protein
MPHRFAEIAFTPAVRALQLRDGSRTQYARLEAEGGPNGALSSREAEFLARADSVYLATVSESGWPYVQHRGGPPGFLHVLSPSRFAFADYRGNRQLVSAGNSAGNDRAALIVVDHARRQRLKLLGRLRFRNVADADPALVHALTSPGYRARVERIASFEVEAFDWNCPQHIPERFTREQLEAVAAPLRERVAELEAQLKTLAAPSPGVQ